MAENNLNPAQATVGLNMESAMGSKPKGSLSFAMNAQVQGFDGEAVVYQMEQSNEHCMDFPPMFKVMGGPFNITQINKVIYFLVNPSTGDSQIGYTDNGDCTYHVLVEGTCLNFSIDHPIHNLLVKTVNCATQFYWTDNFNPRRYIDLENLPWKEEKNPDNDFKPILLVGQLDCNKLLVQPNFDVPTVKAVKEIVGGQLRMGVYQAIIQYADILGNGLSSYYNASNPFGIWKSAETTDFDLKTDKAIEYLIDNLDTSGLYDFFNLAIIKTINGIPTPELVGKAIPITGKTYNYIYTGTEEVIPLTMADIFLKTDYFDRAEGGTIVDDTLVWHGMTESKDINYQQIANKIKVGWETYKIPYTNTESYKNGVNTAELRGYMRDEVYPLEFVPVMRNGEEKHGFHIPGRPPTSYDLVGIDMANKDAQAIKQDPCDDPIQRQRWQVYNTGSLTGFSKEYLEYRGDDSCYKGPYQYGELAYWQSERRYSNNPLIWGDLAGQPVRYPKLPDNAVTGIHDNNTNNDRAFQHSIFPIGFTISGVKEAIESSNLTQEEKDNIIGFKIVRGNRANHKSIVAKGMFNNVGKYTYIPNVREAEGTQTYYYPNYPFNDLRPDPYFTDVKIKHHTGFRPDRMLEGFNTEESKNRFVFYSPDTQFKDPQGIDSGQMKLETIEYGKSYGHFVPVDQNAKYLFINKNGYKLAYGAGIASVINGKVSYTTPWSYQVGADLSPANFPATYQGMLDLLEKIMPYNNFGYSFNSVGMYGQSFPVPNDGNKIRNITFGRYLNSEYNNIENGNVINNYQREESVYLNTDNTLLFPHEYSNTIPQDTSRYHLSSYTGNDVYNKFFPVFFHNNDNVSDNDIGQALLSSPFGGSPVINIQYTGNAVPVVFSGAFPPGHPRRTVEIWRQGAVPKLLGSMTIIASGHNTSGSAFDGDFTGIIDTGDVDEITSYLVMEPDGSSGSGTTVYKDTPRHKLGYNWLGSPSLMRFDTLVSQSYQAYALGRPNEQDVIKIRVRGIYTTITSSADIENLNVPNPKNNEDFYKIVAYHAYIEAYARYQQTLEKEFEPDKIRDANICSYYGSIKKYLPAQWGDVYSYETIDTGFYTKLRDDDGKIKTKFPAIFGGDTFINRYGYKIKFPFFEDNTVFGSQNANIEYDKIASLTHPMFWLSTAPTDIRSNIADFIERKANNIMANGQTLNAFQVMVAGVAAITISFKIIKEVLYNLGVRNLNLDNFRSNSYYEQGIMYLFAYGIPYYFCESDINVDFRHAKDAKAGNFFPNVSGDIPDQWLQEANVSILEPEQFVYNDSYSKQNKENYFKHLRADFDPDKACFFKHDNLAVWSDQSSLEETRNNWLVYKPGNRYNFPKEFGKLISLDRLQNRLVLARYENKSQLYNAMVTLNTSSPEAAYIGNDKLFSGSPAIDLSDSSGGSFGSQHRFLLNTEQGNIFLDAKRGQVVLLRGQQAEDIAQQGMDKWFKHFLPFFILKVDPNVEIDNHFNSIGLTGVYDSLYKRAIITKKDYEPIVAGITYNENGEFIFNGTVISLDDSNYFCDRSWTLSYSFITQSWTSFHSYQPNYYVEHAKYFQSGTNGSVSSIWNHNTEFTSYHSYYGTTYPYILEYPIAYNYEDEILQSIKDYTKSLKYTDYETYTAPKGTHYFNKAVIYNDQQCSGVLNLVPKAGLSSYRSYPIYHGDSKDIQVTKSDSFFNFNTFWNITKDTNQPIWNKTCDFKYTNKTLNFSNLDFANKAYSKAPLRAKECFIRLIHDSNSDIRLITRFIASPTAPSKK